MFRAHSVSHSDDDIGQQLGQVDLLGGGSIKLDYI